MYGESATKLIRHLTQHDGDIIPEYQFELVEQVMRENDELYAENLRTSQSIPAGDGEKTTDSHNETTTDDQNVTTTGDHNETIKGDHNETITGDHNGTTTGDHVESSNYDKDNGSQATLTGKEQTTQDNIDIGEKELMVMQVRHTAKLWNKRCIIAYHYERLNRLKKLRWEYGNNLPREIVEKLSKDELEWFTKYNDNLFSYMSALNDGKGLDLTLYVAPPKKLYVQVKCIRDYGQFDLEDGQPVMLKKDSIHYLPLSQCEKLIHQGVLEQTSL